jgi:hypothetical protein
MVDNDRFLVDDADDNGMAKWLIRNTVDAKSKAMPKTHTFYCLFPFLSLEDPVE